MTITLNKQKLAEATELLCARDPELAAVVHEFGVPPLWKRPQGFRTLFYLILEQQVSLASARATYEKLVKKIGSHPDPKSILALTDDDFKILGFSRSQYSSIFNSEGAFKTNRTIVLNDFIVSLLR